MLAFYAHCVSLVRAICELLYTAELLTFDLHYASCTTVPGPVNDVTDDERRKEEEAVAVEGALCLYINLMYGNNLPLRSRRLSHHLQGAQCNVEWDTRDRGWFKCAGGVLTCNLTVAPMIMLFLKSPMRTIKHSRLFLTAITA